jgi:hypothetical protein
MTRKDTASTKASAGKRSDKRPCPSGRGHAPLVRARGRLGTREAGEAVEEGEEKGRPTRAPTSASVPRAGVPVRQRKGTGPRENGWTPCCRPADGRSPAGSQSGSCSWGPSKWMNT